MKMNNRALGLEKNFKRLFWLQAMQSLKVFNIISTLFYLARSLTLTQVFYLGVIFALVNLVCDIPSSYLADTWGRKRTIVLASVLFVVSILVCALAHSFVWFAVSLALYAASFAFQNGANEALLYDSARELGKPEQSLKSFGEYYSAQRVAKIFTPVIGALIANNLNESQFLMVIAIDFVGSLVALYFALRLVEPEHHMDVEKRELGIFADAIKMFRTSPVMVRTMLGRSLIFISSFILWRQYQVYFIENKLSLLTIAVSGALISNLGGFIIMRRISHYFTNIPLAVRLNFLNDLFTFTVVVFTVGAISGLAPIILLVLFSLTCLIETTRSPLFSEFFNRRSLSHNRAVTLSVADILNNLLQIPFLFMAALLVGFSVEYLFIFTAVMALVVIIFLRLPRNSGEYSNA